MPPGRPPDAPGRAARIPGDEGVRVIAAASLLVFQCWWCGTDAQASADGHHRQVGSMSQDTPIGGHQGRRADGSIRLAPPWAAVAATFAVLITSIIGALVWRSERLGSINAWALREFGAYSHREFQLASGVAASLRSVAICGTMAIAAYHHTYYWGTYG